MTGTGFTDAAAWYPSLSALFAAAAALITDPAGQVLLVKPNYRDHWDPPGRYLRARRAAPHCVCP